MTLFLVTRETFYRWAVSHGAANATGPQYGLSVLGGPRANTDCNSSTPFPVWCITIKIVPQLGRCAAESETLESPQYWLFPSGCGP